MLFRSTEMQAYRRMTGRLDQNHIIADCFRATGQPDRAVPLAEEALAGQRVPLVARVESVVVAAAALADLGRFDQALAMLRRIRTSDEVGGPEALRIWYVTGDIMERAGRTEEGEFKLITAWISLTESGVGFGPILCGVNVGTTAQDESVEERHEIIHVSVAS